MPAQPRDGVRRGTASPLITGVPWWGAVLIAVTMTLAGLAIEAGSGHKELGSAFAIGYALGCVIAVLAVRRSGIFTAIIQPPLILFVTVPLAYYLFHESSFRGLKEAAITCGYPLIERFPLMLFTTSAVLLIGLVRWYLAMARPTGAEPADRERGGAFAGLSTKLSSAFAGNGSVDEAAGQRAARPRHVADRSGGGGRSRQTPPTRGRRSTRAADEAAPPRPRRSTARRPAPDDQWSDQPRRRRRESPDRRDPREPTESRRSPAAQRREPRDRREPRMPREYRDVPREFRDPYPPRATRGSRYEQYDTGYADPAYPAERRRRPATNGSSGTHHPVSRVRYRDTDQPGSDYRDESRHRRPR